MSELLTRLVLSKHSDDQSRQRILSRTPLHSKGILRARDMHRNGQDVLTHGATALLYSTLAAQGRAFASTKDHHLDLAHHLARPSMAVRPGYLGQACL